MSAPRIFSKGGKRMKVGLIGLGRMGEGMSRRMMKAGIEVWGYRRNYAKDPRSV